MSSNISECGLSKVLIFVSTALLRACTSICSKVIMSMSGSESEQELFQKPLFVTFCMFVGMSLALIMQVFVVFFRIPFPGYDHHLLSATTIDSECSGGDYHSLPTQIINSTYHPPESDRVSTDTASLPLFPLRDNTANANESKTKLPLSMYFIIAIPAFLDLGATALWLTGLKYLDVSIFQMLCNSQFLFVALMKHYILKNLLYKFHWVGVFWIVVSVLIGGSSALLVSRMSGNITEDGSYTATDTLIGVALVIAGTVLRSLIAVIVEKLMNLDVPVPPFLLIGMQGFWGVVLSIFVMFPVGYALPGNNQGSFENPFDSWSVLMNSRNLQLACFIYTVGTLAYNVLTLILILKLDSIWFCISTNFSLIMTWMVDLFIFYYINPTFGEAWTNLGYLQIAGIAVLLYGSAIYNAPNKGSVLLTGQSWAFGIDCSNEYSTIKREQEEATTDVEVDDLDVPLLTTSNEGIV